jgi:prepilin-type N-terminal cleavage/methylation domain-containing protein
MRTGPMKLPNHSSHAARAARHSRRGTGGAFTLIEILVVVIIVGIISAIILPQMGTRDDQRAAAAGRVITSDLMYAQSRAIATQKTHYIIFDTGAGTYRIVDSLSPVNVIKHPITGQNYQVYFGASSTNGLQNVTLSSVNFDAQTCLAFDSLGVPYSYNFSTSSMTALSTGKAQVRSGAAQVTVNVAPFSGEMTFQ